MNANISNVGIEHISRQSHVADIPEQANEPWRTPASKPVSHVNKLFSSGDIHQQLEDFIRPSVSNWYLLLPYKFRFVRTEILKRFTQGVKADSPHAKRLQQAADILAEEKQLSDLLDRYRFSLIKA